MPRTAPFLIRESAARPALQSCKTRPARHACRRCKARPAKTQDRQPAETPHYHGHRERLRERFYGAGPDALSDYELLEMALFPALPRRDTKPLAKALLKKFGSFAEVVHAPEARLREVDGIRDASITQLKLIAAAASVLQKARSGAASRCRPGTR